MKACILEREEPAKWMKTSKGMKVVRGPMISKQQGRNRPLLPGRKPSYWSGVHVIEHPKFGRHPHLNSRLMTFLNLSFHAIEIASVMSVVVIFSVVRVVNKHG